MLTSSLVEIPLDPAPVTTPTDGLTPIRTLVAKGQHRSALAALLPLLHQAPPDRSVLDLAASCYWALGDTATAVALMRLITANWPQDTTAWPKYGAMALALGQMDVARAAFGQAVRLAPGSINALAALNRLAPFDRGGHHARQLRRLSANSTLSRKDRATALNALGVIEEASGRPDPAFRLFARANKLLQAQFDPDVIDRYVKEQTTRFDPQSSPACDTGPHPRVVFVVGPPRSGTTLVDRILSRHPQTRSIGESSALSECLQDLRRAAARAQRFGPWDWVEGLGASAIRAARADYLFRAGIDPGCPDMILDKMPLNSLDMGLAHLLFPKARFVFVARNPLDVGVSNFCTNFHSGNGFATRLDWIGRMIRAVHDSLDDYVAKLGPALRVLSYRGLVTRPDAEIRALVDHVGLAWDDACLSPHLADGAVSTASLIQVRHGLSPDRLDRWRLYQDHLTPLVAALGGPDWLAAWAAHDQARIDGLT